MPLYITLRNNSDISLCVANLISSVLSLGTKVLGLFSFTNHLLKETPRLAERQSEDAISGAVNGCKLYQ